MSFGAVAVGVGSAVAGAAVSSALAPSGSSGGSSAAAAADPFASQRGQYQTMLSAMVTGKNADGTDYSFQSSDPSYDWRFKQGVAATNQASAQRGLVNSGDRLMALSDYGQNQASTEYANEFSRLSQLAGANVGSPAAAGQIISGAQQQAQAGASTIGNAVGQAVSTVGNGYLNGGTSVSNAGTFGGNNSYGFTADTPAASYSGTYGSYGGFFG